MDKVLLTVEEAAERLSIGRTKAYELLTSGALESVRIGRCRRIPVEALDPFVTRLRRVDDGEPPSGTMEGGWSRTAPADPDTVQP
jgi:excisionase family DNA binding protein